MTNKHEQVLRLVFSNPWYLILSGAIFASMLILLFSVRGFLFFEPFLVFSIPQDMIPSFISILAVSLLTGVVTAISVFQIRMIKSNSRKVGAGLFSSIVGAGSGICTSCSTVGFSIVSSFGIVGTTAISFLNEYELPIRAGAIAILGMTYFSMIKKLTTQCKIPPRNNQNNL